MRYLSQLLMCLSTATFVLGFVKQIPGSGSCRRAKLCCPGRDSSCVVQNAPVNAIIEDPNDKPCYCDQACLKVGDCCYDFKEACGVADCEVSEWGPWSKCSSDCGSGAMVRERTITRNPLSGGNPCPELIQTRGCYGTKCEVKSVAKARREVALLLPGKLSHTRVVNASLDIRKNLRLKYPKDPAKEGSKEYCVVFEVTKVRKVCESLVADDVNTLLTKGARVCISCEDAAMRGHLGYRCNGHGVDEKPTRWTLVANPRCHGRWVRQEVTDTCTCHTTGKPDFIFV